MPTHHSDVSGSGPAPSGMGLGAGAPTAPMGVSAIASQLQAQASAAAQASTGVPAKRPGAEHTYMNAGGPPPKRMRDDNRGEQTNNDLSRLVTGHDGLPTTLSMQ